MNTYPFTDDHPLNNFSVAHPISKAVLAKLHRLGMMKKSQLKDGYFYYGFCHNARIAMWLANENTFHYLGFKGGVFEERIKHPEDDDCNSSLPVDLFKPLYELPPQLNPNLPVDDWMKPDKKEGLKLLLNDWVHSGYSNQNQIVTGGFSSQNSQKLYKTRWPQEPGVAGLYDRGSQCGGCSFYAPFDADYGLCCFSKSRHHLETVFEHFTCEAFQKESWGAHSFQETSPPPKRGKK